MPDDTKREEEILEKLSEAVRTGWASKHPLTEKQRAGVREALQKQSKDRELSQDERRKRAEEQQKRILEESKKSQERTQSR